MIFELAYTWHALFKLVRTFRISGHFTNWHALGLHFLHWRAFFNVWRAFSNFWHDGMHGAWRAWSTISQTPVTINEFSNVASLSVKSIKFSSCFTHGCFRIPFSESEIIPYFLPPPYVPHISPLPVFQGLPVYTAYPVPFKSLPLRNSPWWKKILSSPSIRFLGTVRIDNIDISIATLLQEWSCSHKLYFQRTPVKWPFSFLAFVQTL